MGLLKRVFLLSIALKYNHYSPLILLRSIKLSFHSSRFIQQMPLLLIQEKAPGAGVILVVLQYWLHSFAATLIQKVRVIHTFVLRCIVIRAICTKSVTPALELITHLPPNVAYLNCDSQSGLTYETFCCSCVYQQC